jgi:hypothetical protein
MKPRKTIILLFIGLLAHSGGVRAVSVANEANLTAALEKYCVPKCTSGCSNVFLATYSNGHCLCRDNLDYDEDLRECIIRCPAGSYAYRGTTCPSGTYKSGIIDEHGVIAAGLSCPSGSYKLTIE